MMKFLAAILFASLISVGVVQAGERVDINTATVAQLQSVKGIGVKTAAAIVAYREAHGGFSSLEDIIKVKGIGEKKLEKMKGALTASAEDGNEKE